jgi:hypothetical protein
MGVVLHERVHGVPPDVSDDSNDISLLSSEATGDGETFLYQEACFPLLFVESLGDGRGAVMVVLEREVGAHNPDRRPTAAAVAVVVRGTDRPVPLTRHRAVACVPASDGGAR